MAVTRPDFAELFREYYPRVYRYVRYRVDDDIISEDLTSGVFERAYRYRQRYDPARASFATWITRIAQNWVNNFLANQKRRQRFEIESDERLESLPDAALSPEDYVIRSEAIQRLLLCLERLSDRDRQVVALRFGMSIRNKEIAELLDLKEHTVSVIVLRTLERLRACQEGK